MYKAPIFAQETYNRFEFRVNKKDAHLLVNRCLFTLPARTRSNS